MMPYLAPEAAMPISSWAPRLAAMKARLVIQEAVLVPDHDGRTMRFARDQVFASPSAAAAVVVGRAANGRNDWKIQGTGVSYGNWQTRGIDPTAKETSP